MNQPQPISTVLLMKTAQQEADIAKSETVEAVHVFIAFAVLEYPLVMQLLDAWNVDVGRLRRVARTLHPVDKAHAGEKPRPGPDVRQVLWAAGQRARYDGRDLSVADILYVLLGRYWPLQACWNELPINWAQTDKLLQQQGWIPHSGEVFRNLTDRMLLPGDAVTDLLRRIGII